MIEQFPFKFYRTLTYFMKTFGLNFKEIEQLFKNFDSIIVVKNFSIFDQFFLNLKAVTDFSNTLRAVTFCKREFGFLKIRDGLFISLIIYGFLYDIFALLDLTTYIKNFRYVIANITENMLVLMTVIKISVLRIKSVVPYILRIMINSTSEYKLPYKIKPLVKPYNVKSYVFDCIHEFLRIIMIISGYLGIHCFFASIGFHLIGQLAILKCKVKNVFNNTDGPRQGIRKIILGHHRLIRLADLFEDSFNIVIGQHLFRTTILLCIPRYRMLSVQFSSHRNRRYNNICSLNKFSSCDELYFCDWYELSTMDMKSIWICMMRCSKTLRLTCVKFCILFIVNKSMAYLCFLRTTLGIDSLANRILFFQRYTLSSQYCELRSLLSPRFYTTLFNRKIVTLYCLFQGYQHPEGDNVEQTIARISRFNGFHHRFSLRTDKRCGEHAHVYKTDEIWGVPSKVATFGKISRRNRKRSHHR
ncbi:odorant receptor 13a-like [Vespula squamosa]|uniref:Odorant receptor 13a-like n=1 Tax=Vespula squamosa TaxID=30214 RepID=A0ABD2BAG6_VESSQ